MKDLLLDVILDYDLVCEFLPCSDNQIKFSDMFIGFDSENSWAAVNHFVSLFPIGDKRFMVAKEPQTDYLRYWLVFSAEECEKIFETSIFELYEMIRDYYIKNKIKEMNKQEDKNNGIEIKN